MTEQEALDEYGLSYGDKPSKAKDRTGERHGELTAVRFVISDGGNSKWMYSCECGGHRVMFTHSAKVTGHCGCRKKENAAARNKTHGESLTGLYKSWAAMKDRCSNPNNVHFDRYGGRGIEVCERWRDSYEAFRDDMGPRPNGATIERIKNDIGYCPENCKWATRKEQTSNRECTRKLTHNGVTLSMAQWSEKLGVLYETLSGRIQNGWSVERALSTPVNRKMANTRARRFSGRLQ